MFLRLRRAQSTSSGERPAKGFPSDALTVMGSLLADSTGGILVFLLAMRGRLLRRGPSFDPAFFSLSVGMPRCRQWRRGSEENGFELFGRVVIVRGCKAGETRRNSTEFLRGSQLRKKVDTPYEL